MCSIFISYYFTMFEHFHMNFIFLVIIFISHLFHIFPGNAYLGLCEPLAHPNKKVMQERTAGIRLDVKQARCVSRPSPGARRGRAAAGPQPISLLGRVPGTKYVCVCLCVNQFPFFVFACNLLSDMPCCRLDERHTSCSMYLVRGKSRLPKSRSP